jgi:tetratricopeptide (TPR) repeat protein
MQASNQPHESPYPPTTPRPGPVYLLAGLLLVAVVAGAYWLKIQPGSVATADSGSQESLMKAGLDALYTGNDPNAAAAQFRRVLALNPNHYGATFQLATALDRAGKPDEARPYWEKMLTMAEASNDQATVAAARARLGKSAGPAEQQAAAMKAGLDALYTRKDPNAAIVEFRKLLELNSDHYGATYQLATALDQAGKPAEARPLWQKVLKMAEGYKDDATVATARARLASNP